MSGVFLSIIIIYVIMLIGLKALIGTPITLFGTQPAHSANRRCHTGQAAYRALLISVVELRASWMFSSEARVKAVM